jgi:nicotinamide-nucleotide amidase
MRVVLLNTGTELLLGDVQERHLSFIAQQIFPFGLRIDEQRTVPDGTTIGTTLRALFSLADIIFVTGGLGPTTDDITREMVAEILSLELQREENVLRAIKERLAKRGIRSTARISRQADVPAGAQVLPNENGTAPGFYLRSNINPQIPSPHLFVLPGPPRELQPMFRESALPILRQIVPASMGTTRRVYRFAMTGESIIEEAVGEQILAVPGIELGYCARPGEVDLRIVGDTAAIERADAIVREKLGASIFSANDEELEEVIVKLLAQRKETLALAESCTGGLLAHRVTNVAGASAAFLAGYITYSNEAKIDVLGVTSKLIEGQGAVSEPVACAMAEGARSRAGSTFALATTGIAGPTGGSAEKPAGTVYIALASAQETMARKYFFPNDRETFKRMASQAAFEMLRQKLV